MAKGNFTRFRILIPFIILLTVFVAYLLIKNSPSNKDYFPLIKLVQEGIPKITDRPKIIIPGYKVYTNAYDNYRIQSPSHWYSSGPVNIYDKGSIFYTKEKEGLSFQQIFVNAFKTVLKDNSDKLNLLLSESLHTSNTDDITLVSSNIGSLEIIAFSGTYPYYNYNLTTEGKIILANDRLYILHYDALSEDFDNYVEEARKIFDTFEIIRSDATTKCFFSLCAGECIEDIPENKNECPVPPSHYFKRDENSYCKFEKDKCKTAPLPRWW